ncbi:iron-containing alcohol dehydrogenase [bacterium]|nr:iron-containing alcohol dehydrogenase [bacterium]
MRFEFSTSMRIIFGSGALKEIATVSADMGRQAFVVTGRSSFRAKPLIDLLNSAGKECVLFPVEKEPTVDIIRSGLKKAKDSGCNFVAGFGGGSAIDTAKAVAVLMTNGGDLFDYLEIIGKGLPLTNPPVPWIAIPTTAGSGAEVTMNSVIASPEHRIKVSLRSRLMLPSIALIDPELTCSLPPQITANTGLDALTHLMEAYVSNRANPMTDTLCREGIVRSSTSILTAFKNGNDAQAREDTAIASLFGGLALANSKLGAVHGIAGPLGGMSDAPHGATCACLLPHVIAANVKALQDRLPESNALKRYDEIAQILTGNVKAKSEDGIKWLEDMRRELGIPTLAKYGLKQTDFSALAEKALNASSMQGNPVRLQRDEIEEILLRSL